VTRVSVPRCHCLSNFRLKGGTGSVRSQIFQSSPLRSLKPTLNASSGIGLKIGRSLARSPRRSRWGSEWSCRRQWRKIFKVHFQAALRLINIQSPRDLPHPFPPDRSHLTDRLSSTKCNIFQLLRAHRASHFSFSRRSGITSEAAPQTGEI
jgi:hypothetical protein